MHTIVEKFKLYYMLVKGLIEFILYGRKAKYLLVDTPIHNNLGDLAIAIAEKQFILNKNKGKLFEVTSYQFDKFSSLYAKLFRKDGIVLVHGGGFIGNLWPNEEYRFRKIVDTFLNNKLIVFPQTVTFDIETDEGILFFNESYRIYKKHHDFCVFTREKKSFSFMQQNMPDVRSVLVPDIVTTMRIKVDDYSRQNILLCMRNDHEKIVSVNDIINIKKTIMNCFVNTEVIVTDTILNKSTNVVLPFEREKFVKQKLVEFAKSKLIITDRLHGMVFAALTGTPCIAMMNSNGKVFGVFEWIKNNRYIYFANNYQEIEEIVQNINTDVIYKYDYSYVEKQFKQLESVL